MFEWNTTTFVFSILNFLILVGVLYKFLNRPLRKVVAERRAKIEEETDQAKRTLEEAEALRAENEAKLREIDAQKQRMIAEARAQAEEAAEHITSEARKQAGVQSGVAERELARQKQEALKALENDLVSLGLDLGRKTLSVLTDQDLEERLLERLASSLAEMRREDETRALAAKPGAPVDVDTARALSADEEARIAQLISENVDAPCECAFHVDPELVAGVRVRFENVIVESSIAGVLADFRREYAAVAASSEEETARETSE